MKPAFASHRVRTLLAASWLLALGGAAAAPAPPLHAAPPPSNTVKPAPARRPLPDAPSADTRLQLMQLMTPANRRALGVEAMNRSQAEALKKSLVEAYTLGQGGRGGGPSEESMIAGAYRGFGGATVVTLLNGHVWQQVDGRSRPHTAFMPQVVVYAAGTGMKMKVDGLEQAIEVRRLR